MVPPAPEYIPPGTQVARGTVDGESIELKAGLYKVIIATSPFRTIEGVEIPGKRRSLSRLIDSG